jgi:hypothetical protein
MEGLSVETVATHENYHILTLHFLRKFLWYNKRPEIVQDNLFKEFASCLYTVNLYTMQKNSMATQRNTRCTKMIEETAPSEDDGASFPVCFATPSTVIVDISNSRLAWRTDFCGLSHSFHTFFWRTQASCTFAFTKAHRCLKQLIPTPNALGRWGITLKLSPDGPLNRNN